MCVRARNACSMLQLCTTAHAHACVCARMRMHVSARMYDVHVRTCGHARLHACAQHTHLCCDLLNLQLVLVRLLVLLGLRAGGGCGLGRCRWCCRGRARTTCHGACLPSRVLHHLILHWFWLRVQVRKSLPAMRAGTQARMSAHARTCGRPCSPIRAHMRANICMCACATAACCMPRTHMHARVACHTQFEHILT